MKIYKNLINKLILGIASLLLITSCNEDDNKYPQLGEDARTVSEIISSEPDLSTLAGALKEADLETTLDKSTTFTLFAPVNSAFVGVDLSGLSNAELNQVLLNHVINTTTTDFAANIGTGYMTTMASGPNETNLSLYVNQESGFRVNGVASGVSGMLDISGSNGVVHGIDGILLPPTITDHAMANPTFSMFMEALTLTGLDATLSGSGTFTLFAPTDSAFQAFMLAVQNDLGYASLSDVPVDLLTEILLYHVISDQNILVSDAIGPHVSIQGEEFEVVTPGDQDGDEVLAKVNDQSEVDANVILSDIQGVNGVVHGVNKVLMSNSTIQVVKTATLNIVDRARDAGYTMFADAVELAGLKDALTTNTELLTVFVPTNNAFMSLLGKIGYLNGLSDFDTDEGKATLSSLLKYHVISGAVLTTSLVDGPLTTVEGNDFTVSSMSLVPSHNNAPKANFGENINILATNGVIHEISNVLVSDEVADLVGYPSPSGEAEYGYEIYDDALSADFWVGGWTTPTFDNTQYVRSGETSIAVDFVGNDAFQIGANGVDIDLTQYTTANASVYSPTGTEIVMAINEQWEIGHVVTIPAGEWVDISVPMTDIAGDAILLGQFLIRDNDTGVANTLYIDQVGFDVIVPVTLPEFTYEIYLDDLSADFWVGGWTTPTFDNTVYVRSGETSIAVDFVGNDAFQIGANGVDIDLTQYTTAYASVYSTTGTEIVMAVNEQWEIGYVVTVPAGQWVDIEAPMADIAGDAVLLGQFLIRDNDTGVANTLYIDHVGFN